VSQVTHSKQGVLKMESVQQETSQRVDWLKWRKLGIGSSDAATLHDAPDAYLTQLGLYEEKLSTDFSDKPGNWAMNIGNEQEIIARKLLSVQFNMENGTEETFEQKWFVHPELEIIRASVDGCTHDGKVIAEFKFQGVEQHNRVADESLPIRGGRVIEKYWIQCQHGLLASGAESCIFGSRNPKMPKDLLTVTILPDFEFQKKHVTACVKFWKDHVLAKVPPKESARDYKELRKKGAKGMAKKYLALVAKQKELKEKADDIKTQLLEMADHNRMTCGALRMAKVPKAGSIDYSEIPAVKNMTEAELEKYRKAGSESWRFDQIKSKAEPKPKSPRRILDSEPVFAP